tara:strand:- start:8928 stop:9578 length:651 start_codon:yes stop_codon:yes gene_type:complete
MAKVREIQILLSNKGFNPGPIDGDFGPKTEAAIIAALSELPDKTSIQSDERPSWLNVAFSYLGLKEIKGSKHNEEILEFWRRIGVPFKDDETPWCAGYVGGVLEESAIQSSRSAAARSYVNWGVGLEGPAVGCVVVFWRGSPQGWSGHVGFVVGKDQRGNLMVIGGNQGDAVNVKPFDTSRVLAYRWPKPEKLPAKTGFETLPVVKSDGRVSTNEA